MKFLHVIPSLDPACGGTVEGLRQLGTALREMGHVVDVVTLDQHGMSWLQDHVFTAVHALGPARLGYRYTPALVPWLRNNAAAYDAVMVEGLWQYHGYATWKALRNSSVPYYVFTHGMLSPWFKKAYPLKHLKKWLYWPWAEYCVLRDARAVLFTCEEEKLLSRQSFWLYRCSEAVVGYGTSRPEGDADCQRELFLSTFPELRGKRIFLFLSRIHEKKGCDLLIKAFAAVADRDESLRLVMAGPDQTGWQRELEALAGHMGIADRMIWTGMVSGDVKWGAYSAAEAFVLPSHQENFGVVVAEALSRSLPVLISNQVNIWREVQEIGGGVVEDDTLPGTIALLEKWLALAPAQQAEMRVNALKCYEGNFDMKGAANRLLQLVNARGDTE